MKTLSRQQFLKTASAAIPAALVARPAFSAPKAGRRPNIVFIFADQMRAQAMGCMGNKEIITPNLDRLAKDGLLVTNAISAQPVCTPYRSHLMTGRYGHSTGVIHNDLRMPDNETVIGELMKQQGYATGYIGKWHLAGNRDNPVDAKSRRGWDFWAVRNCSHQHSTPQYWLNDATEPVKVSGWEPDVQTDLAMEFIKKNKQAPFCLFLSFGPPHNPYKAPEEYTAMYSDKKLTARPNVPGGKTTNLLQYYAMTTSLDVCVGRVRTALDEAGIAEDTVLVFTSDHGDMLGSQGHRLKQRPWEESIHIPFILRYPRKVQAGQRRDWIVSSVDVMPTLLGFCGIPVPPQVQGIDYSATFAGESDEERDVAFLFNVNNGSGPGPDWRGIRTKEWSYAYHFDGDWVMYHLKHDPYQLNNLIDDPKYAAKKKELRQQLDALRTTLGESIPLKGKLPAPIQLPA
ncbi:sulfatase [Pontiella sp.]|uniref:sulfatase family protein n=1 Tax=Pontiella sp. TaxID=2837462 RepID=UPI0035635F89